MGSSLRLRNRAFAIKFATSSPCSGTTTLSTLAVEVHFSPLWTTCYGRVPFILTEGLSTPCGQPCGWGWVVRKWRFPLGFGEEMLWQNVTAVDGGGEIVESKNEQQVSERDGFDRDNFDELWRATAQVLRAQVSEAVWFSTFNDAVPVADDKMSLRIQVPNSYVKERILTRYMSLVRDALNEVGASDRELLVDVQTNTAADVQERMPAAPAQLNPTLVETPAPTAPRSRSAKGIAVGLNPRYTFETFVKGTSNQFALAAAQRVAETPGRSYNPLFIYGSAGLGKTHLLHAIGYYVHQNYAHYEVRYVSTETFLNEYVDGIRNNTIAAFKKRYREVDVLLIDDIQFMEGKEGLQEEFFHTFNSLHGANKQIVISSDRMPDAIPTLEDRLRGRFRWGLITDIQPPDMETRLAILRNKAERERTSVSNEVLEFIASKVTTNIRELEGALIRVAAYASLNKTQVDVDMAQTLLTDLLNRAAPKPRSDEQLLAEIAEHLGFEVEALRGKSRQRPLVAARQTAMYVFRELTDLSYPAIARLFGGRDHTTVIHAVDKTQRMMKERKQVFDQVTELVQKFKTS
jgi:chromosomal replication initiator protein